jgi:hypothetical protein
MIKPPWVAVFLTSLAAVAHADYQDWCGWTNLAARIGDENVPNGAGVILGQVESADSSGHYLAFDTSAEPEDQNFSGKWILGRSGGTTNPSSHATMVGGMCYGHEQGMANGITFINAYEVNDWLGNGHMRTGQGAGTPPKDNIGLQKIWNNSWVGSLGTTSSDHNLLRRLDWIVSRDDVVVIVGISNGTQQQPLLSYGYNSIAVGRRNGDHASGDVASPYEGSGRMRPDLVAPLFTTSEATATISAAAAMLIEQVRDAGNSLDADGETPEVVKAILMASATHNGVAGEAWSNNPAVEGSDRGITLRPIDETVGAGHVNVDHAHLIMSEGKQLGAATGVNASSLSGWSLETMSPNQQRSWLIASEGVTDAFSAAITWNRTVANNFSSFTLADFDLELLRLTAQGEESSLIGSPGLDIFSGGNIASSSSIDNVEHLYVTGLHAGRYILRLTRPADDAGGSNINVGVAWISTDPRPDADIDGDGDVGIFDLLTLLERWGGCDLCEADIEGSGLVDVVDLQLLIDFWLGL